MRNYKRILGGDLHPTYRWSSYGDQQVLKFFGFFILLLILPIILWLMWQEAKSMNDDPKVSCSEDVCLFQFEDGTRKMLPRESVPFDENGAVMKDRIIFTD